jgi:aryl-alcohol dehydrogenase-like predicted oxidoreductase
VSCCLLTGPFREGKIRHIGLSGISSNTLRRASKIAPVDAVQLDYSPFVLEVEGPAGTDLLSTCREFGTTIVAAMPLGRGMITPDFASNEASDGYKDSRVVMPRFMEGNLDQNVKIVNQFKAFADKKGCTMPQLALAWLLKQGNDIIPIPGTKNRKYLEENWAALDVDLSTEEEAEIRRFLETAKVAGNPLPQQFAGYNYVDTVEKF